MPTQFEVVTAAAWWYFAQQQVDIAVIETGLGGRLDATNVVERPLVSVITSISMDHWQRLGNSLTAIASEKAGIIKYRSPVAVGELPPEAKLVIANKAKDCESEICWVEPALPSSKGATWRGFDYDLALLGKHQLANSALAIATIQKLQAQGWHITDRSIKSGLSSTKWQARLQLFNYKEQPIWLDGAHNLAAAEVLRQFFDQEYAGNPCAWVIGILETKDWQGILKALLKPSDRLYAVKVPDHQSCDPKNMASLADRILVQKSYIAEDWQDGLNQALSDRKDDYPVILSGSLYLVGACLQNAGVIN
jgi:dihydrofolate synthase/folylpolyglutamate synthase